MKLADIRKNVVTTYHYTTIGGEELVFEIAIRLAKKISVNGILDLYPKSILTAPRVCT